MTLGGRYAWPQWKLDPLRPTWSLAVTQISGLCTTLSSNRSHRCHIDATAGLWIQTWIQAIV